MNCKQALKLLKTAGSAQTKKTYTRHGIVGPMYGVKYSDLYKLQRQIKIDHPLALLLWDSGNYDARILATLIGDPSQMTMKSLTLWLKDVDNPVLSAALSNIAQKSPSAVKLMHKWIARDSELAASTGWMMLSGLSRETPEALTKVEYRQLMTTIRTEIHSADNRVKHAMNRALISIGTYVMEKEAIKTAESIGKITVDHGDTSCKTPMASSYIRKEAAKHRAKLDRAAKT